MEREELGEVREVSRYGSAYTASSAFLWARSWALAGSLGRWGS